MNGDSQRALEELAGHHLAGLTLGPYVVGSEWPPPGVRGVYVIFDPTGRCAYVGKAFSVQDSRRVRNRIRTHVANLAKRDAFSTYYVIPLKPTASSREVEVIEGWVARHMRPYMGQIHPDPRRRPR